MDNMECRERLNEIYYTRLKLCGCGDPNDNMKVLSSLQKIYEEYIILKADKVKYDERVAKVNSLISNNTSCVADILLTLLENAGYFEHGGYIGNGWPTEKAEELSNCFNT